MTNDALDFQVRHPEIEKHLKEFGRQVKKDMPEGWGFALLMFEMGKGGSMFYLSSAERESMIEAMEEFIAKQKGMK